MECAIIYEDTDALISLTISGGRVWWPWYFLFAHTACAPVKPTPYAWMNHAKQLAYLQTYWEIRV